MVDITNIREDDEYSGNKYHIVGKSQGLKVNLEINISTGDKITPRELKYKYLLIFGDRTIMNISYKDKLLILKVAVMSRLVWIDKIFFKIVYNIL